MVDHNHAPTWSPEARADRLWAYYSNLQFPRPEPPINAIALTSRRASPSQIRGDLARGFFEALCSFVSNGGGIEAVETGASRREAASAHGTEVRLTPRPSEGDSCAVGRSAMPLTTRIESRNTRHASPSGLGRNRRNLFPSLSPWFVNLDSEPWVFKVMRQAV